MSDPSISGQILGASTSIAAGVAMLPYTGESVFGKILAISAVVAGTIVLLSFLITFLLKKFFK